MFSLFPEDDTATESGNLPSSADTTFNIDIAYPNNLSNHEIDRVFYDWQHALYAGGYGSSEGDGRVPLATPAMIYPTLPASNEAANIIMEDNFLTSISNGFAGYFAQTGINDTFNVRESLQPTTNPQQITHQMMRVPENADSPSINPVSDNQLVISMADVLPQVSMAHQKLAPLPKSTQPSDKKSKEKKSTKDKNISKVKKQTKAAPLVGSNYVDFLQLAIAADAPRQQTTTNLVVEESHSSPVVAKSADNIENPSQGKTATGLCRSNSFRSLSGDPHDELSSDVIYEQDVDVKSEGFQDASPGSSALTLQRTNDAKPCAASLNRPIGQTIKQGYAVASRHKREKASSHTPRPPNSFIIYRKEKHAELMSQSTGTSTLNNNVISKIVGTMWKQEPPEVKAMYAAKAQEEKRVHMLKHPDYKYRPKKNPPKQHTISRASSTAPPVSSGSRFVKVGGNTFNSQQKPIICGSISAMPPPIPSAQSCNAPGAIGGMGMSMSAIDDFQYCAPSLMNHEFYTMPQGVYQQQHYAMPNSFESPNWDSEGQSSFIPMYWTSTQLNQEQSPQPAQFDQT